MFHSFLNLFGHLHCCYHRKHIRKRSQNIFLLRPYRCWRQILDQPTNHKRGILVRTSNCDTFTLFWLKFSCFFLLLSLIISTFKLYHSIVLQVNATRTGTGGKKSGRMQKNGRRYIKLAILMSAFMVVQAILILTLGLIEETRGMFLESVVNSFFLGILWLRLTTLYFFETIPPLVFVYLNQRRRIHEVLGLSVSTMTGSTSSKRRSSISRNSTH